MQGRGMAIWRTPCQILLLLSFLLLNKSFFLEAAESHSTRKIGSCIENERKALLELKTTLNDPSGLLSSWVGKNCCNWTGISCSDETGNVVKLDLKNFNLCSLCTPLNQSQQGGTLNLSFLNLPYLSYLDISWNNFQGIHIPKFIGSLKNLQYLDLSENNFIGKVPPSLGNLSNLEYLDLSHSSNLWASDLNWLSGLTSIKYLGLNGLNLSLAGANWLQAVNMLPSLTELHLADCELNTSVPELEFVNFSSLQVLDLSNNNFSSSMPSWLFNISTLCNLQRIDLSDNKISGDIYEFMEALARCSNNTLTHIDLSSNHLKGNLPESIGSLRNLEDLLLTRNSFSGSFPMLIGNLSSLERLDLSFNSMNGIIPESIGQLTSLYQLDLFGNSWEGIITENHFRNLSSLFYFSLSSISKSVIFNLSQDWIPCFSLVELAVSDCQLGPAFPSWLTTQTDHLSQLTLSSAGISDAIPDWFWSLASRLSFVDLSDNQLTGKLPKLASFDGSMDLGFNLLEGSIPIWPNVISLSLRNNLFSGPIPSNIGQGMLNVEALDLSRNFLNGSIPASINNMASLRFLDLSSNDLSGLIPNQLLGLQNLMTLDLSKNNLSGPSSLCSLPSLLFLNLKGNNLSGELAATLQNCSGGLNIIDLGENQFSGIIPGTVLGNLSYLYYLGLRANLLTGSIPQELCKFTGLHIIDLAQNNLSGAIPECLGNLEAFTTLLPYLSDIPLTEDISFEEHVEMVSKSRKNEFRKIIDLVNAIDLSSNNLVGEIPDHLTKLSQLGTLNLSWNHLTGRIPDNIGNLRRLETLDLSHNNLSGTIPPSMSSMTLLNYLNVSFNNLSGQIPTSNQFQTFNDPSIYQGNPKLCGPPLLTRCSPLSKGKGEDNNGESEDEDKYYKFWFYVSMGLGFIVGFWVVCGSLLIKQTWRRAYFKFVDETKDRLFVVIRSIISRFPKEDCGRMMMCLR